MTFTKIGEAQEIKLESSASCIPEVNEDILESFRKTAAALKKIAPKADDFLYFSAVIIHAAEASAINDDGTAKLNPSGDIVRVGWDTTGNTFKWQTNDASIMPYKNCFIPGTKVLMENGSIKAIEDVSVGDMVITHKGRARKVLKTFITPHNGKALQLKIKNNENQKETNQIRK